MADYYIRTQDREDSRGPFDTTQLLTLAEAGQITPNTLYYDETKEEWRPIALDAQLKSAIFPEREKLSLKINESKGDSKRAGVKSFDEEGGVNVNDMLAAAEGVSDETRHLKKKQQSLQKAATLSTSGIGLMMLLSAVALLMPHFTTINQAIDSDQIPTILNYPFVIIGLFDFIVAAMVFLAVTEIYPIIRARAMLTFGFGVYIGWAIGDPMIMFGSAAAGVGVLYATISQSYSTMIMAILLGIGGNATLAYLSYIDRFAGFFDSAYYPLISSQ